MSRAWFSLTRPYGQPPSDKPGIDTRPAIIRRVECPNCEHFRTNWYPKDDQGNDLPKHFCQLLDVENERIEQENQKRHPEAQLKYYDCPYGKLEDLIPRFPLHGSDYVTP